VRLLYVMYGHLHKSRAYYFRWIEQATRKKGERRVAVFGGAMMDLVRFNDCCVIPRLPAWKQSTGLLELTSPYFTLSLSNPRLNMIF
jgi:hypothetical protein